MKPNKKDIIALQKHWYSILKESGFQDAEKLIRGEPQLIEYAEHCYRWDDEFSVWCKESYYAMLGQAIESEHGAFRNEIDRYILIRYSEGARIKEIVDELIARNQKRDRKTVRVIIKRYEALWGIRFYLKKTIENGEI